MDICWDLILVHKFLSPTKANVFRKILLYVHKNGVFLFYFLSYLFDSEIQLKCLTKTHTLNFNKIIFKHKIFFECKPKTKHNRPTK